VGYTAIIGTGALSAAGAGLQRGYDAVVRGADCLHPVTRIDTGLKEKPLCGQISEQDDRLSSMHGFNSVALFGLHAARESLRSLHGDVDSLALIFASTVGGMTESERFYQALKKDPGILPRAAQELSCHEPTAIAGFLARQIGATAFHCLSTACSTGLHAIGIAHRFIQNGEYECCCACGADMLSLLTIRGFASLMLIDPKGCKPFDKRRVGISLGEGAGAVTLASDEFCHRQGITPLAYVAGWGASADSHHMTAPHPDGRGARLAVDEALKDAHIDSAAVDFIAAHGTATPDNDSAEIAAFAQIFTPVPPFCSMKRTLGHTLAASGTLESVYAIELLRNDFIPPTAGFEQIDPAIGIAPSKAQKKRLNTILKTSFGFGGNNGAIVFTKKKQNRSTPGRTRGNDEVKQ
jgi:3-oxoacyl-(acyl-carrier-protein) synthase